MDDPTTGSPRATLFDAEGRDRDVAFTAEAATGLKDDQLLWVDVDRADATEVMEALADPLGLAPEDIERITGTTGRARLVRTSRHLHLTLHGLDPAEGSDEPVARELDIVAGQDIVVTIHDGPIASIDRYLASLTGETRLGAASAADLMSSLVDEVISGYFAVIESIERDIDRLDGLALKGADDDDLLAAIVRVRRRIGSMRRLVAPHRDALAALARPDMRVEEGVGQPWPGLVDRLERVLDGIDGLRDSLLGTFDLHMARAAHRANDVMKTLTLLSAILLPAALLAGIMGMNFSLPMFDEPGNFWVVVLSMAALAGAILGIARWRRWI
jgi:magnesium transporter